MKMNLYDLMPKIKKEVFENDMVYEYIHPSHIDTFLNTHFSIIEDFLKGNSPNLEFYQSSKVPFIFIYKSLKIIKHTLKNEKLSKFESQIAKFYIKKEILQLKEIAKTPYDNTLLFKSHNKFLRNLVHSIEKNDLYNFPLANPKECNFKEILSYPKSQMIIKNHENYEKVNKLHNLLHKSANSFYQGYIRKKYSDAYFSLQSLKEYIYRFIKLLSELYFETFVNLEESFFNLAYTMHKKQNIHLAIIDIRNLKNFNLIYGERNVNKAIKIINERLQRFMKQNYSDTLIIKADSADFFMLKTGVNDESFKNLLQNIHRELSKPIYINNIVITLPIIIAGCKYEKEIDFSKDQIIHSLTLMKEYAKEHNKNIHFINSKKDLISIITEKKDTFIINKLQNKEVDIMFQPIFKTENHELFALEVLGRIEENNKLLPAGMFIDEIYKLNLIEKFDSLILEKLIEKEEKIKEITDKVFLNISFQSLLNPEYMKKLKTFLEIFNIEVILELTEQKFVSDLTLIKEIYEKYGIKFAVDDFGTGYSSLHLVVELVEMGILKILKIDGSLIKNIEKNDSLKKIVSLISKLGNDFNLLIVAEFVENKNILKFLKEVNIQLSQGFYLSKPKTINELLKEKEKFEEIKRKNFIYKLVY